MTFWITYAALVVIGVLGVLTTFVLMAEVVRDWTSR